MNNILVEESDLFAALGLLFAADLKNCREMLGSLQESDVKKAYRKKALQTHPDRFAALGEVHRKRYSERFIKVNNAYEMLSTYLKQSKSKGFDIREASEAAEADSTPYRRQYRPKYESENPFRERRHNFYTHSFWRKDVPGRRLRFAEFLYYSGIIPWKHFIRALAWQSKQRPRLGEIAQRWRWLTESQILEAVRDRRPGLRIGELLLHHRIISPFQLNVLLWQQRKLQKPIGEYFVQHGLLSAMQIHQGLFRQERHNLVYPPDHPVFTGF